MTRVPVVLISDVQYRWDLLFATIDFDYITISAIYGDINQLRSEWRTQLEAVFRPIEYFGSECGKYDKTYFIFNTFGDNIRRYLKQNNIDEQYIISLEYPEERFQNVLLYYAQYKFLENNKPSFDFFATGISFTRDGFDVPTMLPWKGVTFAFPMQDLYYSYQIAKKYLSSCINHDVANSRGGGIPKFCIIGLAPYQLQMQLCFKSLNYHELPYLPILGHDKMEYKNTKRGDLLQKIFFKKCNEIFRNYALELEGNTPNFADIDGMRKWTTEHQRITILERIELENEYSIYKKKYPKTVEFNLNILDKYLSLCHKNDIIPFGVLFPFSVSGRRAYPNESVNELKVLLSQFKNRMYFINLWNMDLPDNNFRNVSHLNIFGSQQTTRIIKQMVDNIIGSKTKLN